MKKGRVDRMKDYEGMDAFDFDEDERTDPRFRDRLGDRIDALVPDTVKKLALAGMGAIFMTEEGIRNAVSDLKLPREAVTSLLSQTEKARNELFRMIAVELRRFLEEANIAGELRKVLVGLSMDVNASISFRHSDEGGLISEVEVETGKPSAKAGRSVKKKKKKSVGGKAKA